MACINAVRLHELGSHYVTSCSEPFLRINSLSTVCHRAENVHLFADTFHVSLNTGSEKLSHEI
jgi:hypothetical protein